MVNPSALIVPLKSISVFPGWSDPESDTDYSWFNAPLEIAGVTEPGFVLHGGCYIGHPERHVSLELRLSKSPGRKMRPLERIDWRSLKGGHTNQYRRGVPVAGQRVSETHLHAFELNFSAERGRMWDHDLPYAAEIEEDLDSFEALRKFAGIRFRINNINLVTPPPWEYKLALGERL